MNRHSSQYHFSNKGELLQTSSSLGGSLGLFSILVIFQVEMVWYIFLIIFIYVICYCAKRMRSEEYTEESTVTTTYTQPTTLPSIYDVERQPTPRSLSPQQKYSKTCPSCGGQLEEGILKQLIISNRVTCPFCGKQIQIY